jgi:hypothetical protein
MHLVYVSKIYFNNDTSFSSGFTFMFRFGEFVDPEIDRLFSCISFSVIVLFFFSCL